MWFPKNNSSGDLTLEVQRSQEQSHGFRSNKDAVKSVFNSTRCYDLMQPSSKAVVFETIIPFQLAFYALVEHDTEIAPLWDPDRKVFVAMMTMTDFIQALRVYRNRGIPVTELASKSIGDMINSPIVPLTHGDFEPVDAEDSVYQMCRSLQRQGTEFVPVVDPDEGGLVAILGYQDLAHLLDTAAAQYPHLFVTSIEDAKVGTYPVVTAPRSALLSDILNVLEERRISSIPIVDEAERVIGLYYKSDTTFITRAQDPGAVMASLASLTVGEVIQLQQSQQQTGESLSTSQGIVCTCTPRSSLKDVLRSMMSGRSTRVVCVDELGRCLGIVSIKDIVWYYLDPSR